MTWQAATFLGLAIALASGFAWYERSRPSARLVALVAALAALAVAGRLVLAPIPNVVATTDVVLITGYALGAGPGFAVGALAAPISNIWLGQGPWTAWQMAGWGLVGLGGAWLALGTRRRLGRLGLATACALAGFAYGALLDLSTMVTYGGEQSLDRYLVLSGRGLPFNVAHALGNFAIALAAGPALVRMISRFRNRLEFTWHPAGALPLILIAVLAASALAAPPQPAAAGQTALAWLRGAQNADGGYAATPGQSSSPAMTGWAMLGLEAVAVNPLDVRTGGLSPVAYLRSEVDRLRSAGDLERTILALAGAGVDPRHFAGEDLVAALRSRRDTDGSVDGQVNLTAFYALAMRAGGRDAGSLRRSAEWLREAQNRDGGWGIQPEAPSEADSAGAAVQGLIAAGSRGRSATAAASWLRAAQRGGGGYALGSSGVVNSQSTAWAVQGLAAAGSGGDSIAAAQRYLGRLQAADGHYAYSSSSDQTPIWVTAQVLLAVEARPFPLAPVPRQAGSGAGSAGEQAAGGDSNSGGSPGGGAGAGSSSGSPSADSGGNAGSSGGGQGGHEAGSTNGGSGGDSNNGGDQAGVGDASPGGGADGASPVSSSSTLTSPSGEPIASTGGGGVDGETAEPPADEGGSSAPYVIAGFAALALALAGGFAFYRRRLP